MRAVVAVFPVVLDCLRACGCRYNAAGFAAAFMQAHDPQTLSKILFDAGVFFINAPLLGAFWAQCGFCVEAGEYDAFIEIDKKPDSFDSLPMPRPARCFLTELK